MRKALLSPFSGICFAQLTMPDGTKLRVRVEQTLAYATAAEGRLVELTVKENVRIGGVFYMLYAECPLK